MNLTTQKDGEPLAVAAVCCGNCWAGAHELPLEGMQCNFACHGSPARATSAAVPQRVDKLREAA